MIPKDIADEAEASIDSLMAKDMPPGVKPTLTRLKQVFENWAAEDDSFVPIDFSEADLKEASLNVENAFKKEIKGFDESLRSLKESYVNCMNDANDSDDRIKCRSTFAIGLCETASGLL